MEFNCTKRTLKNMETKTEVSVQDILGIFQDIVKDIDQPLDELPAGEGVEFVSLLAWTATEISYLLKKNEKDLATNRLGEKVKKRQEEIEKISVNLKNSIEQIKVLQAEEQRLLKVQKEKEQQDFFKNQLENHCIELEQEIKRYSSVNVEDLRRRKQELEQKKEELKKLEQELSGQCNNLETEKMRLNSVCSKVQGVVSNNKKQIASFKNQLDVLQAESQDTASVLKSYQDELAKKKNAKEESEDKVAFLVNKINAITCELENKKFEASSLEADLQQLQTVYDNSVNKVTDLEQKITLFEKEVDQKKKEISDLTNRLDDLEVLKDKSQKNVQFLHNEIVKMNQTLESQDDQIASLKKKKTDLIYDIEIKEGQVKDLEQKLAETKGTHKDIQSKKEDLDQKVSKLKSENEQLQNKIFKINREKIELEKEKNEKQADFELLNARVETLGSEKKVLITKINDLDENISTLNIDVLKGRYKEKAEKYKQLKSLADEIEGEEKQIIDEISGLEIEIQKKTELIENGKAEVTALEHKKDSAVKDLENIKSEKEQLEKWFKGMEYQGLTEQMQKLKKRLSVLNEAKTALSKELDKELFMTSEDAKVQIRNFREDLEKDLRTVQETLNNVQIRYANISKIIYE